MVRHRKQKDLALLGYRTEHTNTPFVTTEHPRRTEEVAQEILRMAKEKLVPDKALGLSRLVMRLACYEDQVITVSSLSHSISRMSRLFLLVLYIVRSARTACTKTMGHEQQAGAEILLLS